MKHVSQNFKRHNCGVFTYYTDKKTTLELFDALLYFCGNLPPLMLHTRPGIIPGSVIDVRNKKKLVTS